MEPAVPIFGTVRLSVLSQELDTNEPVNPDDLLNRGDPMSRKMQTIGLGNWSRSDLQDRKSRILLGGFSCLHETNRHAHWHGLNWKRLFPTMQTCLIYKSKSKTLFVKQGVVIRQNLMSWYRQW